MTDMEINKGTQGAKRASWAKLNYRDLALRICADNPGAETEDLAKVFMEELERYPDYMQSIAIYIMANVRASLDPAHRRKDPGRSTVAAEVLEKAATKVVGQVLMTLTMPSGKMLGQSTGSECIKAGGWLVAVGRKVGPRNLVGQKLTEDDLRRMIKG